MQSYYFLLFYKLKFNKINTIQNFFNEIFRFFLLQIKVCLTNSDRSLFLRDFAALRAINSQAKPQNDRVLTKKY